MEGRRGQRERLRAQRQAAESQDVAAERARKRRVQYLALAGFAAVAVIVALIVISQSGGGGSSTPSSVTGAAQVDTQLKGIPQSGQLLGDSGAPVTVIEYGDPQCSSCKFFSENVAPDLISSEVRPGRSSTSFVPS